MESKIKETTQKRIFIKSYPKFEQIEALIKVMDLQENKNPQISIIGTFDEDPLDAKKNITALEEEMETKCKALFPYPIDFGILSNPEIGTIFITGFLVSTFLQEIERKEIGAMLTGPYGILRGLGIYPESAALNLKALQLGRYLLIVRGTKKELKVL